MGGKGSGRKREFRDQFHQVMRDRQFKYDREIAAIRKKRKCGFKEAQSIRKKRKKRRKRKKSK